MIRKTSQSLAPLRREAVPEGQYDIYPAFPIGESRIGEGYDQLAGLLSQHRTVVIDGYVGVLWDDFRKALNEAFERAGVIVTWLDARTALRPESEIDALIEPFLGADDPIFGTRFTGKLIDFFDTGALASLAPASDTPITILYGCGAALADLDDAFLVYLDVPKNEIQFRSRAGSICNLGASRPSDPKAMYKRFYFVDWVVLNSHKAALLPAVRLQVDAQRPDVPVFMHGDDLRESLDIMGANYFRVRPWFEPGAWGGQWMKQHIPQLPQDVPNYAWSFELIVPENGLIVESDGLLLEFSFDYLMYRDPTAITGSHARRFGYEFPIRFDFLDTFDGGNLSVQCHPRPEYIARHFGETYTQDETYYILDAGDDAEVYLGFQAGIDPQEFRGALEHSIDHGESVDIRRYVQVHPARKHDLFLIPNGTIHCSGNNNLVLEISATPYIFTFKMYDWLRLDLDGRPRPLNIDRAFENLRFDMQGDRVRRELLSKPQQVTDGNGWRLIHVPTHAMHFYDVRRFEIEPGFSVEVTTDDSCQIMSLVEGAAVELETRRGMRQRFSYAETFVVPAAAEGFRLINVSETPIKVVNVFMKAGHG